MRRRHRGGATERPVGAVAACALLAMTGTAGCGGDEEPTPSGPVTTVTPVVSEGFQSPLDAVVSPDGSTFYFTAYTTDAEAEAAIFSVPAEGGAAVTLHAGTPLALPTGLVLSCDGGLLVVADMATRESEEGVDAPDGGALYTIAASGGALSPLMAEGIYAPSGLALSDDCVTLYVTGTTAEGMAALFKLPLAGGTATVVHEGAPLRAPTGMYVDRTEVAWVLDHISGSDQGALYAIHPDGTVQSVMEDLALGTPGGCSLDSAGGTAFVPTRAEGEPARLTTIELATGKVTPVDASDVLDPAGLRTARGAPVFALVDHDGNSIFRVQ